MCDTTFDWGNRNNVMQSSRLRNVEYKRSKDVNLS